MAHMVFGTKWTSNVICFLSFPFLKSARQMFKHHVFKNFPSDFIAIYGVCNKQLWLNSLLLRGRESVIYCCNLLLQWDGKEVGGAPVVSAESKSLCRLAKSVRPAPSASHAGGSTELEGVVESL